MSANPDKVDLRIEGAGWEEIDAEALARRCFAAVENAEKDVAAPVSILLTDDAAMRKLNAHFRSKDKPTNVLSFPPGDIPWPDYNYLGDLALGFETCKREAAEKNISLADHAAHLMVHGMLHLLGYDHENDAEAEEMERRETEILAALGVGDPYAESHAEMERG
ncbi:MAG: rRNA maturation RNase YbeY [Parvularculaceae bacterium]